ncbi:peptidase M24, structural domain-containing protein [Haematococcus lacustris]
MRAVGQVAAQALARAAALVAPGVTTDQLDQAVHRSLVEAGAYPSPLGFKGFPKSCCTSVNEVVVHGIPDSRPLAAGDLLNVDVTAFMDGHHADTSATFMVGGAAPSSGAEEVVAGCWRALQAALAVCGPGVPFRQLGQAVQAEAAALGLHTQPRFSGHGIGRAFHAAPSVRGAAPRGWWDLLGWLELLGHTDSWSVMRPGQAFTIEPILIERNGSRLMRKLDDGWTWVSTDRSLSAQFEVTVVVRRPEEGGGCEVLTPPLWQAARSDAATQ